MRKKVIVRSGDEILARLNFKPYLNLEERRFERFLPGPGEANRMELPTSRGGVLVVTPGDYLVSDVDDPGNIWPVDGGIFEETYIVTRPGYCAKRAYADLVPLVDLTGGDPDQEVTVHSLEGVETVRAGDFYLARGVQGELWVISVEEAKKMRPAD